MNTESSSSSPSSTVDPLGPARVPMCQPDMDGRGEEFDLDGFEAVTALDIYRAQNKYGDGKIFGPVCPIDAFGDRDREVLRSGIADNMLREYRIGDRSYVRNLDLITFSSWTGARVSGPARWRQDLEAIVSALHGIDRLDWLAPPDFTNPFLMPDDSARPRVSPRTGSDEMVGPIVPIDHFGNDRQQALSWCARAGLIPSLTLEGTEYFSYCDVYGRLLSDYFNEQYDHPAAWDVTYAEAFSSCRRVRGQYVMPRGFKDAVRSDFFPRISLRREAKLAKNEKGELRPSRAAYPRHVADGAAEMFRALYRDDGFLERFRRYRYDDAERDPNDGDRIERLGSFGAHEIEWFRKFAAEGGARLIIYRGEEYITVGDLIYYDIFAAKIIEDQLGPGAGLEVGDVFEVMLDGTLCRDWPWQRSICLWRGAEIPAAP